MAIGTAAGGRQGGAWSLVERLCAADGSATHPWVRRLLAGDAERRDLADSIHALCILHGRRPGMADEALARDLRRSGESWLTAMADGFAAERAAIATLVAAAGPLPSTPGHAASEAAILGQHRALEMLARSDREGCATGAVAALALDWATVRRILAAAAGCFGTSLPPQHLPSLEETAAATDLLGTGPAAERAIGFGAQQLFAQHRGLWSLLEARASARG